MLDLRALETCAGRQLRKVLAIFDHRAHHFTLRQGEVDAATRTRALSTWWGSEPTWYPGGTWGPLELGLYVGLPLLCLVALARGRRTRPLWVAAAVFVLIPVIAGFRPAFVAWSPLTASPSSVTGVAELVRVRRPRRRSLTTSATEGAGP